MSRWFDRLVKRARQKLREWRDLLNTPILPEPGLVPIPVRNNPRPRR